MKSIFLTQPPSSDAVLEPAVKSAGISLLTALNTLPFSTLFEHDDELFFIQSFYVQLPFAWSISTPPFFT